MLLLLIIFLAACFLALENVAAETETYYFDIPETRAGRGLNLFAQQTRTPLLFLNKDVRTRRTNKVMGKYTFEQALARLLEGTGIQGAVNGNGVLTVSLTSMEENRGEEKMTKKEGIFKKISAAVVSVLVAGPAGLVQAQGSGTLEEIIVTAQRREQSLQEVPVSIETISGSEVLSQGFRNMEELSAFVPGFIIDAPSDNNQAVTIRGIGSSSNNWAIEQSVPIFVDGVHYGRGSSSFNALLDVERVEVLRGPQPIFFGQNAAAGAVSVISRKPGNIWEGYLNAGVGNNHIINGQFGAGGPVTDTIGIRFAGKYESTEGFMTDVLKGSKYPKGKSRF